MDQKKNQGQQSEGFQGQQQGSQRTGQQNWNQNQPQTQNPKRDQAEGPRQHTPERVRSGQQSTQGSPEFDTGRERSTGQQSEPDRGGGITNRDIDEEMAEQEELPERGKSQSER